MPYPNPPLFLQFRRQGVAKALLHVCDKASALAGLQEIYLHVRQVRPWLWQLLLWCWDWIWMQEWLSRRLGRAAGYRACRRGLEVGGMDREMCLRMRQLRGPQRLCVPTRHS